MANGISLHIGLNVVDPNHYGGWSGPLNACEADAQDIAAIAQSQGFNPTKLLTANGTRAAVIDHIRNAAGTLASDDIYLLSYSGHGGQVPDINGDEADLQDETWCLYDGQLLDDELNELWARFAAGVRVLVLSDSCHSGTVTRAPAGSEFSGIAPGPGAAALGIEGAQFRFMPDDAALKTYRDNKAFYDKLQNNLPDERSPIAATIRLISGCQDNQLSLDGTFNGLFTSQLLRVWRSGRFNGGYDEFHREILRRMPPTQSPNHFVIGTANPAYDSERPFTV